MSTLFQIVGGLAVMAVAFAVLAFVVLCLLDYIDSQRDSNDARAASRAIRDIGQRIKNQSYWFTEDIGAWVAIEKLGEHLHEYGGFSADSVRDKWRADARIVVRASKANEATLDKPIDAPLTTGTA